MIRAIRPMDNMLETRNANGDETGISPVVNSLTPLGAADGTQLSTVYEIDPPKRSYESKAHQTPLVTGLPPKFHNVQSRPSRDASPSSTVERIYDEKLAEHTPQRLKHKPSTIGLREQSIRSKGLTSLRDGTGRDSSADESLGPTMPKKAKGRGLRTILRRMFSKKPVKNRISMPAPVMNPRNDPNTFITSATDLTTQRSASVPTPQVSRSSALGSHAPFSLEVPPEAGNVEDKPPKRPDRSPTERPARPRRASLPSVVLSAEERDTMNLALAGLGLQDTGPHAAEGNNIGFAVTSGSNPKRRSRSAGTFRDHETAKEHRMSPIQWRQWRRRSDEIRYWRESVDGISPILGSIPFIGSTVHQASPAISRNNQTAKDSMDVPRDDEEYVHDEHGAFNFELQGDAVENQERMGVEERLITLEIKLMDFEYVISKLQADGMPRRHQTPHELEPTHPQVSDDRQRRDLSQTSIYHKARPSEDSSAPSSTRSGPMTPPSQILQGPFRTPQSQITIKSEPRPNSVATTLKAAPGDRSSRNSFTGLTVEHYTTLITLIRREQSARLRLEDQVSALQQQLHLLNTPSHNFRDFSGRHASPETSRQGRYRSARGRGRSSNYSETDTDDASFHEVYVTPVERGEFERQHLGPTEEGVAF